MQCLIRYRLKADQSSTNRPCKILGHIHLSTVPCNDCDSCGVTCPTGFDIKTKMMDIARLKEVPK